MSSNNGLIQFGFNLLDMDFLETLYEVFLSVFSSGMKVMDRLRLLGDAFGVSGKDAVEGIEPSESMAAFKVF